MPIGMDWKGFGILLFMLCANGCLGCREEMKGLESLAELTAKMETKITVHRDGAGKIMLMGVGARRRDGACGRTICT